MDLHETTAPLLAVATEGPLLLVLLVLTVIAVVVAFYLRPANPNAQEHSAGHTGSSEPARGSKDRPPPFFSKVGSSNTRTEPMRGSYRRARPLLSAAERSFFGVLHKAVDSEYHVFTKVRLADIVQPAKSSSRTGWQKTFNRICGKHVDFVLCDLDSVDVKCVIELDDKSHSSLEAGFRDSGVDSALGDASIPILRVRASHSYSVSQVKADLARLLNSAGLPQVLPTAASVA